MLVLSRKEGEAIMIGEIRVVVSKINGNKVSLAIDAPRNVPIRRAEIQQDPK